MPPPTIELRLGYNDQIPLPPETTEGTFEAIALNTTELTAKITEASLEPPELAEYFDPVQLKGLTLRSSIVEKRGERIPLVVRNPRNPGGKEFRGGRLKIRLSYEGTQLPLVDREIEFQLKRFPDYEGIFAIDYGNTATTCVVLPGGVVSLFEDVSFRALDFDQPESTRQPEYPSAIQFKDTSDPDVRMWKVAVGETVLDTFRSVLSRWDEALVRGREFQPGGLKRYINSDEELQITSEKRPARVDELTRGTRITGNDANGKLLQTFVRQSETWTQGKVESPLGRISRVVATRPVNFTPAQIAALKKLFGRFLDIPPEQVFTQYDEATAAAIYFLSKQFSGQIHRFWDLVDQPTLPTSSLPGQDQVREFNMLVFDCGGGTTDIALVSVSVARKNVKAADGSFTSRNWFELTPTVVGLTGLKNFAGDNMTLEAFKLLRFRLACLIARHGEGVVPDEKVWSHEPDRDRFKRACEVLRNMLGGLQRGGAADARFADLVEERCKYIVPTDFSTCAAGSPEYNLRRGYYYQLWDLSEKIKRGLSEAASFDANLGSLTILEHLTAMGDPDQTLKNEDAFQTITIARQDLDERLYPKVREAWLYASELCEESFVKEGEPSRKVHQIVLAGNGSKYPLVKKVLKEVFAGGKVFQYQEHKVLDARGDAKLAVAKGAAIAKRFENRRPAFIDGPDALHVSFVIQANPILPYSIYVRGTDRQDEPKLLRGLPFKDEKGGVRDYLESTFPPMDEMVIARGVRDSLKRTRDRKTEAICKFERARPLGAGQYPSVSGTNGDTPPPVAHPTPDEVAVLRIDREMNVRVFLRRVGANQEVLSEVELEMFPVKEADAGKTDPNSGYH